MLRHRAFADTPFRVWPDHARAPSYFATLAEAETFARQHVRDTPLEITRDGTRCTTIAPQEATP